MSLAPNLHDAAEFLAAQSFGNTTAYFEHLMMKELEAQGVTIPAMIELVKQWRHANENASRSKSEQ